MRRPLFASQDQLLRLVQEYTGTVTGYVTPENAEWLLALNTHNRHLKHGCAAGGCTLPALEHQRVSPLQAQALGDCSVACPEAVSLACLVSDLHMEAAAALSKAQQQAGARLAAAEQRQPGELCRQARQAGRRVGRPGWQLDHEARRAAAPGHARSQGRQQACVRLSH